MTSDPYGGPNLTVKPHKAGFLSDVGSFVDSILRAWGACVRGSVCGDGGEQPEEQRHFSMFTLWPLISSSLIVSVLKSQVWSEEEQ